ncbi:MAG: S24 family peptidase [Balneolaceae bacterium]|nr:S24 family peptidase [Balneolaceae bacterium]
MPNPLSMQTAIPLNDSDQHKPFNRPSETGFPSPATDHLERPLNLQKHIVRHPASTFFVRVGEEDHSGLGLSAGDILVVDRSLAPRSNCLVIAELHGEHRVCRLHVNNGTWILEDGSGGQHEISFHDPFDTPVWGRVTHVVHSV